MAHIVAEPCFDCKYTDCVVVCPVDCFYEGAQMLYIHPDECIDCEACVPECPVEAIFHEDNLPDEWKEFTALNAEQSPQCPVITEKKDAWAKVECGVEPRRLGRGFCFEPIDDPLGTGWLMAWRQARRRVGEDAWAFPRWCTNRPG